MFHPIRVRLQLLAISSAAVLGLTLSSSLFTPVYAQGEQTLEEITVTGSRIVRRDFESNSPIVTIDNADLESQSGLNVESYLNQLPNYNPAAAPTIATGPGSNSDVQITAINSVGIAAISLRGFGPNRNLILVDGKRPVPINALMVTDINEIPSSMIQRVETITGGASAVYGADAVGGVTNFILRNDFEGLEIDSQYSVSEAGDGEEYRGSAIMGADVANGRGNITIAAEYYNRKIAFERNRDYYKNAWADTTVDGDLFVFGYNGYNSVSNFPNATTIDTIFSGRPATTGVNPLGGFFGPSFRFNPDGSVFSTSGDTLYKYQGPLDGQQFALVTKYDDTIPLQGQEISQLKWNNPDAYVSAPQERYSFMASGHYDITDKITFFSRATFAQSKTKTWLIPTNASFGWEASIPFNAATDSPVDPTLDYSNPANVTLALNGGAPNGGFIASGLPGAQHPVPAELAMLLLTRVAGPFGGGPTEPWVMETYPLTSFHQRATINTQTVWQAEGGLNVDLPWKDWTGELYFSHGESSTYNIALGNNSLARWRQLVTAPDYGRGANLLGNNTYITGTGGTGTAASPGFGAGFATCESGFYDTIFGNGTMADPPATQDCIDAVTAQLQSRTQIQQDIVEVNLQGGVMDLPAGELRGAAGFQYRKDAGQFYPDILQSAHSYTDQVIGVYPTAYLDESTSVNDFYVEALVPILKDLPYLQKLELETGARYSDYNKTDSTWTYKFLGNAQINDWLRLRGGYNRASRAPNLGELFLNQQELFTIGGVNFGDPCGGRSNAPWGAATAAPDNIVTYPGEPAPELASGQTPAGAASTYMICQAQMGPGGAFVYYNFIDAGGSAASPFAWIYQQGNPNLTSEKADTFTAGLVFSSPFDNPWLAGLTGSLDWWMVDINDAIQLTSIDYANYLCYGTVTVTNPTEAAAQAATPACQNVGRNAANGFPTTALVNYDNFSTIATSGIDFAVNWNAQLSDLGFDLPGGVGINVQATWLDYYKTKASEQNFDVEIDWKGSLGPTLAGTNAGAYEYRTITNFTYTLENKSVSLRWRHLPAVYSAGYASQQAIIANNNRVAAGGDGIILNFTPGTEIQTNHYDMLDMSFNWQINDMFALRGGIDNLFDWAPPNTGDNGNGPVGIGKRRGYAPGTQNSACDGQAPGCQVPVGPVLPSTGAGYTNGGYYDTLGRRFFVGLKMSF